MNHTAKVTSTKNHLKIASQKNINAVHKTKKAILTKGYVHSIQSLGALDGPGLRTVIFMQGCPLQCQFCHSIDSTIPRQGSQIDVETLVRRVMKNQAYWKNYRQSAEKNKIPGGVTITGGDPLFQGDFVVNLVRRLKQEGVHVIVESELADSSDYIDKLVPLVDLWMVSIKHLDWQKHRDLTGMSNVLIQQNLRYLDKKLTKLNVQNKPKIRIRFVVVPGHGDDKIHIKKLGDLLSKIENLEMLELLPYVTLGRYKWIELYGKYDLDNVPEATADDLKRVMEYLRGYGVVLKTGDVH